VLSNFHVWAWLLVMLGYGRNYLSFNHKFLRYSNEAVYPFYILHQTVIIFLAYQFAYMNCGIPLKFIAVASGTFLICWGIYAFAIKPWNALRMVFGMKALRARTERTEQGQGLEQPVSRAVSKLVLPLALLLSITAWSREEGRLVCRKVHAPSLSHNAMGIADDQQVVVYLPPSYGHTNRRFPVLYFLPNFRCELWRYTGGTFQGFRFEQAMARQLRAGTVKEMIIVVPNAVHFLGSSWYRNSMLTGNWEDFISQDLVSYIDAQFRTIGTSEGRALAGHGVGGLGALELTLKHPDVFGSVYAMSPAVLDEKGLANFGSLPGQAARVWSENLKEWKDLDEASRRKRFRDFIQACLNSPSSSTSGQGWLISCAAAVSPDPRLPFPHIAFPLATDSTDDTNLMTQFESGMGGWKQKLQQYAAGSHVLRSITIEYGATDQYDFVRHGSDYVSGLMRSMGIKNELAIHEGGHESTLGKRLEREMLPSISNSLRYD
jgi:S-formylglutathione hydrolase FrmB